MTKLHNNEPYKLGIRTFYDKKYIWLINEKGNLTLHGLHRPPPEDEPVPYE